MTERYPMLPPAADSTDSIIRLCPPDDRPEEKPPGDSPSQSDDQLGMIWWNGLTKQERAKWSAIAGNTGRAKDAWEAFKRAKPAEGLALLPAATVPAVAAAEPDPIFAAIELHREPSAHYEAAVSISGSLPCGADFDAAEEITAERCHALLDHASALIRSEPTTIAGVIGLTRYVGSLEEWQTPADRNDRWEASWHQAFANTLASALEAIIRRGA